MNYKLNEEVMKTKYFEGLWNICKGFVIERYGKLLRNKNIQETGESKRVRGKIQASAEK